MMFARWRSQLIKYRIGGHEPNSTERLLQNKLKQIQGFTDRTITNFSKLSMRIYSHEAVLPLLFTSQTFKAMIMRNILCCRDDIFLSTEKAIKIQVLVSPVLPIQYSYCMKIILQLLYLLILTVKLTQILCHQNNEVQTYPNRLRFLCTLLSRKFLFMVL